MEFFLEGKTGPGLTQEKPFRLADRLYAEQIVYDQPDRLSGRTKEALLC
jgi:hypothetical protein